VVLVSQAPPVVVGQVPVLVEKGSINLWNEAEVLQEAYQEAGLQYADAVMRMRGILSGWGGMRCQMWWYKIAHEHVIATMQSSVSEPSSTARQARLQAQFQTAQQWCMYMRGLLIRGSPSSTNQYTAYEWQHHIEVLTPICASALGWSSVDTESGIHQ
jgi:hypothetical protein